MITNQPVFCLGYELLVHRLLDTISDVLRCLGWLADDDAASDDRAVSEEVETRGLVLSASIAIGISS